MTLIYTSVFGFTIAEFIFLVLLMGPFGSTYRKRFCCIIQAIQLKFQIWMYILYSMLFLLFVDSLNTAFKSSHPNSTQMNMLTFDPYSHCKVFYAQRNVYLTFLALVFGVLLYRIPCIMEEENRRGVSMAERRNVQSTNVQPASNVQSVSNELPLNEKKDQ